MTEGNLSQQILRFFLLSFCVVWIYPTVLSANEKPVFDQVVEIVSSDRRTIRKWVYSPKVAMIYDDDPQKDTIQTIIDQVNSQVPNFPKIRDVEFFDLNQVKGRLAGKTRFRINTIKREGHETKIVAALFDGEEQDITLSADIFIFLTRLETGILFGALTSDPPRLGRAFAEGGPHGCYFNLFSRDEKLEMAFILINSEDTQKHIEDCLYEEFMQSFGLLNDSQNSTVFTFDNLAAADSRNAADIRLLKALYSKDIMPGDPPEKVAEEYMKLSE